MPGTLLNLNNCEFIGNETNHDSAVICIQSDAHISNSTFTNFGAGAIFTCAKPDNEVIIQDCKISDCTVVGVYVQGEGACQLVLRLQITNVVGPGIKVGKGSRSKIKGNVITLCQVAIDCVSN
jgi:hypothetical protein